MDEAGRPLWQILTADQVRFEILRGIQQIPRSGQRDIPVPSRRLDAVKTLP